MNFKRLFGHLLGAVGCAGAILSTTDAGPHQPWGRGISSMFAHDGPSITLVNLRQDKLHLTGGFFFENVSGPRQNAKDVTLDGVTREVDQFWPRVRYEARRDDKSSWQPLGTSSITGKAATLTVKAESPAVELWVRLDVFQPFMGKYLLGRIVLSSGETGEFALSELAPPPGLQR